MNHAMMIMTRFTISGYGPAAGEALWLDVAYRTVLLLLRRRQRVRPAESFPMIPFNMHA
jgi:hypothetical protein